MIAPMDQLTVVGRRGLAHELVSALQTLGVVQVDPVVLPEEPDEAGLKPFNLADEDAAAKETWDAIVAKSDALLNTLSIDRQTVGRADAPAGPAEMQSQLDAVGKQVDDLLAERSALSDDLDVVKTYLPVLRDLAPTLAQFDDSRFLYASAFLAPAETAEASLNAISEALNGNVAFQVAPRDKEVAVVAAVLDKDKSELRSALSRAGLAELSLPERYAKEGVAKASHLMEERSQSLPGRLESLEASLQQLGEQHGAQLFAIHQVATNNQTRLERLQDMAAGRYGLALQGWLPSSETSKVVESLRRQFGDDLIIDARNADDHHDHNVPVKLDNPEWVKPFEGLLSLFAPPKYGTFDPAWTLAVFFPLFFGIVVGDMGFALAFAALALWMRRRGEDGKQLGLGPLGITINAPALRPISTVILWCAAWSFVWGLLYGEFFGNFLEHWPANRPIFYAASHFEGGEEHGAASHAAESQAEDHGTENHGAETEAHGEAVGGEEHGAAVVDTHAEDAHSAAASSEEGASGEHGEPALAQEEAGHTAIHPPKGIFPIAIFRVEEFTPLLVLSLLFGIVQVLGAWFIRAYYGFKHDDMKHVYEGVGMFSGLLGLIIFATAFLTSGVNGFTIFVVSLLLIVFLVCVFLSRVFLMLVELLSNAGNILSYLRLFAVGLSAALVANLATDLGFAISGSLPIIGPLLGILVALTVHVLAIALTIIGHTLQPLRLNYVEFFKNFGFYDESGRPYAPFRLLGGKA